MLFIVEQRPSQAKLDLLASFQSEVDALPMDIHWKEQLDKLWADRSKSSDFDEIKDRLKDMCPGAVRCCYCEDSAAASIEHIEPKVFYPGRTFDWNNYLYICGICNTRKNASWAIFTDIEGRRQYFKVPGKKKRQPRSFPPNGEAVLINPRAEDPTNFMELAVDPQSDKLNFWPMVDDNNHEDHVRANFSIKTLHLNGDDRPELAIARRHAYQDYFDRLSNYERRKNKDGWSENQLQNIISRFMKHGHPTVWFEIKRAFILGKLATVDPDFSQLLETVPEALTW